MEDTESIAEDIELAMVGRGRSKNVDCSVSDTEHRRILKSLLDQFQETAQTTESAKEDALDDSNTDYMTHELVEQVESFIVQVAKCYQSYGCPTNTNEVNLVRVAKGLGVEARVLVFPTQIFMRIDDTKTQHGIVKRHSRFFRTSSGYNFYKLRLVDELVRKISSYAQNSQLTSQTPQDQRTLIEEAFLRAREHAVAVGARFPHSAKSFSINEESLSDQMISDDPSESNQDRTEDANITPKVSAEVAPDAESPGNQSLADLHKTSYGSMSRFYMRKPHTHALATKSKLAEIILALASVGPNVYKEDDNDSQSFRNVFLKLAIEDGVTMIRAIINQKPLYSIGFKVLWTGIASFASCGLFYGGSWIDCGLSGILGSLIATIELISIVSPTFSCIFEFTATFTASMIIRAISAHYKHVCYDAVVVSSIVYYLQGATITMGFVDLMTKDIISGTSQVFVGVLISAMIGFAMDLSTSTYASMSDRSYADVVADSVCEHSIDPNWYPLMCLIAALGFNILLESHRIQLPAMIFIASGCYLVYYYIEILTNNEIATILAAFAASLLSNLYSRRTGQPAVVYIIPAIFLLVPDSMDNAAFYTILLDKTGSLSLTFAVVSSALSIAVGIFAASVVVPVPDIEEYFRKVYASFPGPHSKRDTQLVRREKDFNSGLKF